MNRPDEETHVELAVLDKSGRLQLPKEYLDTLGLAGKNKIRVEVVNNRIILINPENMNQKSVG